MGYKTCYSTREIFPQKIKLSQGRTYNKLFMKYKQLLRTAWEIVILDVNAIKQTKKVVTSIEQVWVIIALVGLATFLGQFLVTRHYTFAPEWWWFVYYAFSVVGLIVFFMIFSYILAYQTIKKIHWNDFFIPAGLGAIITWITIIPYFTPVSLWYVVVLFQIIKTLFQTTNEKAALVVMGGILCSLAMYNILHIFFQWPAIHWYI